MRKTIIVIGVVFLIAPLAALADSTAPVPGVSAGQMCKQQRSMMGTALFDATYGSNASKSNAFGRCVARNAKASAQDAASAAAACKAEQDRDPAAFAKKYGTNGKAGTPGAAKNALGKCVSAAAAKLAASRAAAISSAAKACAADRKADAVAFAQAYGRSSDAFGKCVSAKAKTK